MNAKPPLVRRGFQIAVIFFIVGMAGAYVMYAHRKANMTVVSGTKSTRVLEDLRMIDAADEPVRDHALSVRENGLWDAAGRNSQQESDLRTLFLGMRTGMTPSLNRRTLISSTKSTGDIKEVFSFPELDLSLAFTPRSPATPDAPTPPSNRQTVIFSPKSLSGNSVLLSGARELFSWPKLTLAITPRPSATSVPLSLGGEQFSDVLTRGSVTVKQPPSDRSLISGTKSSEIFTPHPPAPAQQPAPRETP